MRLLGARFAVDDAGAGYASMRHVTELRPEFVKLDAKLVAGLADDSGRFAVVRALETFSQDIGATLIAEGVERPADLAHLAKTGLPILLRGYGIGRPGPAWPSVDLPELAAPHQTGHASQAFDRRRPRGSRDRGDIGVPALAAHGEGG